MIEPAEHYLEMAKASRAAASEQVLVNVRQKHLTAAASWDALALVMRKAAALRRVPQREQSALTPGERDDG